MTEARFTTLTDQFDEWRDELLSGTAPMRYQVGTGELDRLEIAPGDVKMIGGAPGAGKTALTMQLTVDALRLNGSLRACVCNVEMSPTALLNRQLARLSGIDLTVIRDRRLDGSHADRLDLAFNTVEALSDRLAFVRPPYTLENIAASADEHHPDLLVLDYIQRIRPPGEHGDKRGSVNAMMDYLRQFADAGMAVIVLSAVGRTKDDHGRSSYSGSHLSLASFRESSELEFGADDAFILHPEGDEAESDIMRLRHLKSRHGETRDLLLRFDRPRMSFETAPNQHVAAQPLRGRRQRRPEARETPSASPDHSQALAGLWGRSAPASDDADYPDSQQESES